MTMPPEADKLAEPGAEVDLTDFSQWGSVLALDDDPEPELDEGGAELDDKAPELDADAGEGAGDDTDDDPEDGDDDVSAVDDKQAGSDADSLVEVDYEGRQYKIPAALKDAHLRWSDYTQKTQQLAQERQAAEQELGALHSQLKERAQRLDAVLQHFSGADQQVDWKRLNQLAQSDPDEYIRQRARLEERQALIAEATQARDEALQVDHAKQLKERQEWAESERKRTLEVIKEWQDEKARKADIELIRKYGTEVAGLGDAELRNTIDHRLVRILRDAAYGHKARARAKEARSRVEAAPPKALKPGARGSNGAQRTKQVSALANRAQATGNVRDLGALLAGTMAD